MNFTKYWAYACSYCGSSEPVIKESLVFIQPGALHGVAMKRQLWVDLVRLPQARQDVRRDHGRC